MTRTAEDTWAEVDRYFAEQLAPADAALEDTLTANAAAGLPRHDVSPVQGKFLFLLARMRESRAILEIGTLGGYSTIWLARALAPGGRVTTLEIDPARAEVARANLRRAGVEQLVDIRVGKAAHTLRALRSEGAGPFDLIFIDADKPSNREYLELALELSRPGTVIIGDNVVRNGAVADDASADPNIIGVRRFVEAMARHPRLSATALQTVGVKGYDGFSLALVLEAGASSSST